MEKIYVVYWSQTGNTLAMAQAAAEGVEEAGKEAEVVELSAASLGELKKASAICNGMSCNGRRGAGGV